MGAIMCVGVATANSILMVTFANDQRKVGRDAARRGARRGHDAPAAGAHDGAGDDHRHAADVARAWARAASRTRRSAARSSAACSSRRVTTLFFVPVMYSLLRKQGRRRDPLAEAYELHDRRRPDADATPPADAELGFELPPPARAVARRAASRRRRGPSSSCSAARSPSAYLPRHRAARRSRSGTRGRRGRAPRVAGRHAARLVSSDRALALPGSVQPLEETVVYPRASGYVRKWLVDIGDKVEGGRAPRRDRHARARSASSRRRARSSRRRRPALVQAEANRDLLEDERSSATSKLVAAGRRARSRSSSRRQAQATVDEASVKVAGRRTSPRSRRTSAASTQLKAFAQVTAPFAGTVTARTIERGALVTAGNGDAALQARGDRPRARLRAGAAGRRRPACGSARRPKVTVREFAGQPFDGTVARTAGALDAATRTMNTEVRVPNPTAGCSRGMYARGRAHAADAAPRVRDPGDGALQRRQGAPRRRRRRREQDPLRADHASSATRARRSHVPTGLDGSERIVKLASAELSEGMAVEILPEGPPPPPPGGPAR